MPSAPFLPAVLPYSEPPTVAEYRQRREGREESEGKTPERKRIEQTQLEAIEEFDKWLRRYQEAEDVDND